MMNIPDQPTGPSDPVEKRSLPRLLAGPAAALVILIIVGRFAGRYWPEIESTVSSLGFTGYLLFAAAWVLLSITFFPVSVLGVSAGALFGPWVGMALVFPAGLAGGSAMFWLGRGLLRERIRQMISTRPKLAAVDRLAGEQALKLNALTRLSPLNFGLASYTLAAGSTSFRAYFWGMFATLPSMMAQVWFGSLAREAARPTGEEGFASGRLILMIGGLLFFLGLTWMVGKMIKQAWDEAPDDNPKN
ncbi:MAG: TVP38/TMEM64 family protein [Candidatus Krumholzibacteria bacterium]|nr:TVP38/TMEM64 family protein [Candidatus Krumholzibacteria bacterium]